MLEQSHSCSEAAITAKRRKQRHGKEETFDLLYEHILSPEVQKQLKQSVSLSTRLTINSSTTYTFAVDCAYSSTFDQSPLTFDATSATSVCQVALPEGHGTSSPEPSANMGMPMDYFEALGVGPPAASWGPKPEDTAGLRAQDPPSFAALPDPEGDQQLRNVSGVRVCYTIW